MQGEQGVVAHVTLPPQHELDKYDKLELDFTLGCPGVHLSITSDAICVQAPACGKLQSFWHLQRFTSTAALLSLP